MPQKKLQQLANARSSSMRRTSHVLFIIVSITSCLVNGAPQPQQAHGGSCIPDERAALLSFRKGITEDGANHLASWQGRDCCLWKGVKCSKRTGHVVKLHLRNPNPKLYNPCDDVNALFGEISPSLLSLKHLEHMDLSMNCLLGSDSQMPQLLGSMRNLRYLNLSGIPFTGTVLPQLGNLSKLQYLDMERLDVPTGMYLNMGPIDIIHSTDITWLANLPKLKYLDMSGIDLSGIADWAHI